ncbi:MAG: carbon starvation protein A [Oscillospiraceae bacterium]|jgi:carbon starvation protein|nr:carbon starvation protein A [Oscillospiraceae bacterium]
MNGILMMAIAIVVLGGAYLLYGGWLAKKWGVDPDRKTPAVEINDGVDYVPSDSHVVFGHQFASIAGAGPINGPIQAAIFGWVPVLLWILIGGVFIGAVQDFSSMFASVRNKGRTIGYIIEQYIGKAGKKLFLAFCWLFSILVVAAFADVVAGTFNGFGASVDGVAARIATNGSVATTSMIFIIFALALGLVIRYAKLAKWQGVIAAVAMLAAAIAIGLAAPMYVSQSAWHIIIFLYVLVASVVPIWLLLQPRDYLNSYLLVAMIAASVIGVFVANPSINLPAFTTFNVGGQSLFPMMFVTIACGAVSGFHSLVSSGTASKQITNERHMLPISFGGMLLESLLAVISLIAIASFASVQSAQELGYLTPPQQFAGGVASFLTKIGLPHNFIFTLINLSVSAFALTSLDSVARVGRLAFQEFFQDDAEQPGVVASFFTNKYVATVATLLFAYLLAKAGYTAIWPLFGSANQLLSALALIACAVFLKKTERMYRNMIIPIFFMIAVTFTALIIKIVQLIQALAQHTGASAFGNGLQLVFAVLVLGLGVCVAGQGVKMLLGRKTERSASAGTAA